MSLENEIEKVLTKYTGKDVIIIDFLTVGGGSINETFKITTSGGDFFVKKNSASLYPQMFKNEALGLSLIRKAGAINTPDVIGFGESGDIAFLILKFINEGVRKVSFWDDFAMQLAILHKNTDENFGLNHDNYIGSLKQNNHKHNSWTDFFREERLEKQVRLARNNDIIDKRVVSAFDNFYAKLDNVFPKEPPALLHGDLWAGNFMVNEVGAPVVIDPAVYYGNREMDLGMTTLFGGFDRQFYISYNNYFPLENGWEKRLDYCNLYPLMVHVNLFGGSYVSSVLSILKKF